MALHASTKVLREYAGLCGQWIKGRTPAEVAVALEQVIYAMRHDLGNDETRWPDGSLVAMLMSGHNAQLAFDLFATSEEEEEEEE
jgi:hypothetical protein